MDEDDQRERSMQSFNPSDENGETDKAKEKPEIVAHPDKPPKTHL